MTPEQAVTDSWEALCHSLVKTSTVNIETIHRQRKVIESYDELVDEYDDLTDRLMRDALVAACMWGPFLVLGVVIGLASW